MLALMGKVNCKTWYDQAYVDLDTNALQNAHQYLITSRASVLSSNNLDRSPHESHDFCFSPWCLRTAFVGQISVSSSRGRLSPFFTPPCVTVCRLNQFLLTLFTKSLPKMIDDGNRGSAHLIFFKEMFDLFFFTLLFVLLCVNYCNPMSFKETFVQFHLG